MRASVSAGRGFRHVAEVHVGRQALDVGGRAFKQQRVAHADHDVVDLAADVAVAPVDRQRIDAVAPPQAHRAHPPTDHAAIGRDENLDGGSLDCRHLVDPAQLAVPLQRQKLGHLGPENDAVAHLERDALEVAAQRLVAPDHVDQTHALALEQLHAKHLAPDQVAVGGNDRLGEEPHLAAVRQHGRHARALRQEPRAGDREIDEGPDHDDRADGQDLEDAERLHPRRAGDAVHQQVGRGPEQRHRAADDGGVAERDQKFRRGGAERARKLDEDRDHHHDERRVVHDRGGERDGDETADDGPRRTDRRLLLDDLGQGRQRAGADKRADDDEHRRDGPGRRVGKDLHRVLVGQDSGDEQDRDTDHRHDFGGEAFAQEEHEHRDDHGERQESALRICQDHRVAISGRSACKAAL